jgi:hypothetical protein
MSNECSADSYSWQEQLRKIGVIVLVKLLSRSRGGRLRVADQPEPFVRTQQMPKPWNLTILMREN